MDLTFKTPYGRFNIVPVSIAKQLKNLPQQMTRIVEKD